jgi:glycosyltransferase involved in cell wall biosynthesis
MECTTPDVSVVIPLYNKGDVLSATLSSVLGQSHRAFELIIVDDGSTDDGSAVAASHADARVTLIRQKNQGVAAARNRGIREARGTWIAFIDADDLWEPDHLEMLVSAVGEPGIVGAFSNIVMESNGRPAVPLAVPSQRIDDYFAFALTTNGYAISSSSVLIERRALIDCGLFAVGTPVGEDIDMWCRVAIRGAFQYVANPSATYRDTLESSALVRNLKRQTPYPPWVRRLHKLISSGEIPDHMIASARRYGNFLLLEYARQLIDRGDYQRARQVLLEECTLSSDPRRYVKRLMRTWSPGRWGYQLVRRAWLVMMSTGAHIAPIIPETPVAIIRTVF